MMITQRKKILRYTNRGSDGNILDRGWRGLHRSRPTSKVIRTLSNLFDIAYYVLLIVCCTDD